MVARSMEQAAKNLKLRQEAKETRNVQVIGKVDQNRVIGGSI